MAYSVVIHCWSTNFHPGSPDLVPCREARMQLLNNFINTNFEHICFWRISTTSTRLDCNSCLLPAAVFISCHSILICTQGGCSCSRMRNVYNLPEFETLLLLATCAGRSPKGFIINYTITGYSAWSWGILNVPQNFDDYWEIYIGDRLNWTREKTHYFSLYFRTAATLLRLTMTMDFL